MLTCFEFEVAVMFKVTIAIKHSRTMVKKYFNHQNMDLFSTLSVFK